VDRITTAWNIEQEIATARRLLRKRKIL